MVVVEDERVDRSRIAPETRHPILQRWKIEADRRQRPDQRVDARHVKSVLAGNEGEGKGPGKPDRVGGTPDLFERRVLLKPG